MDRNNAAAIWVAVAALLAGTALATPQQSGSSAGSGGFDVLLDNESVQKELKLNEGQIQRIKEVMRQVRQRQDGARAKIQEVNPTNRQARLREVMKIASDETLKAAGDILNAQQLKRLKQIQLQQQGLEALSDPDAAKVLKLTDDQKNKVQLIQDDLRKESTAVLKARPGGSFQENLKKILVLRREALDKGLGLLTAEQMEAWKGLAGDPFEVKFESFFRRPPGETGKPGESGKK
jgi:Spy/CpxP family protein refolding chaperone